MKKFFNVIIVVEGKTDAAYLRSFVNCEVVITNGLDVPRETLNYLSQASLHKKIYILADNDNAGNVIRNKVKEVIKDAVDLNVFNKNKSNNIKNGVAETNKEEILFVIKQIEDTNSKDESNLTMNHLYELGLIGTPNSNEKRQSLSKKISCGTCNGKTLLKRLKTLNIKYDQLTSLINKQ